MLTVDGRVSAISSAKEAPSTPLSGVGGGGNLSDIDLFDLDSLEVEGANRFDTETYLTNPNLLFDGDSSIYYKGIRDFSKKEKKESLAAGGSGGRWRQLLFGTVRDIKKRKTDTSSFSALPYLPYLLFRDIVGIVSLSSIPADTPDVSAVSNAAV